MKTISPPVKIRTNKQKSSSDRKTLKQTLAQRIISILIGYFRSQIIVVLVVTATVWILLTLLNVRFPFILAVITGACSIIPAAGMPIAAVLATLVAIFDGSRFLPGTHQIIEGIVILLLYGTLNFAVDYFLSPYLLGKLNNIHPVLLVLSVLIGTLVFGLAGTILAIPTLLIIKTVIEYRDEYTTDNS